MLELQEEIESGREMKPIRVHALHDGTYVVKDGRHRIEAHLAAGLTLIAAVIENLRERMRRWITFFHTASAVFFFPESTSLQRPLSSDASLQNRPAQLSIKVRH